MGWGALYYAFAVLAPKILAETGWRAEFIYGAFSWSLVVAAIISTPVGLMMDRLGGRMIMTLGSMLCGIGLVGLSISHSIAGYIASWTILGLAMPMTLYEAAFATINRQIETDSRRAISTLTLFGGFASTIFWPLTMMMDSHFGWRDTYYLLGLIQLAVCFPLHAMLGKPRPRTVPLPGLGIKNLTLAEASQHPAFWRLAFAFAANSFVFSAMSVHLITIFEKLGHGVAFAVLVAALIGPMQVLGRLGEIAFSKFLTPQAVGKFSFGVLPFAFIALIAFGSNQIILGLFCMLYGMSNGVMTIVRGTLPQTLFGRENYGAISGALAGPSLVAKAAGPVALAAISQYTDSTNSNLIALLAFAVVSTLFYLSALRPKLHPQPP